MTTNLYYQLQRAAQVVMGVGPSKNIKEVHSLDMNYVLKNCVLKNDLLIWLIPFQIGIDKFYHLPGPFLCDGAKAYPNIFKNVKNVDKGLQNHLMMLVDNFGIDEYYLFHQIFI